MAGSTEEGDQEVFATIPGRMFVTSLGMMKLGGSWLARVRTRIQTKFHNGSDVTWGSSDKLLPEPTVRDIEEIAASAVAAYVNEDSKRGDLIRAAEFALKHLERDDADERKKTEKYIAMTVLRSSLRAIKEGSAL